MTLDRHPLDGIGQITTRRTLPAENFEQIMRSAGYRKSGSAPGQKNRLKVWWVHSNYRVVESIYEADGKTVVTAYHP